ncbi:MAG: amidohydrolase family protein [Desulfomonilia bacterium]
MKERENIDTVMQTPLPALHDPEGDSVPPSLPPIIDAHVHVFPDSIFTLIRTWFDQFAWPIRYRLSSPDVLQFLLSHGVNHVVALQYAHKPGIAWNLNQYMSELCSQFSGRVTGMATIFPGEDSSEEILKHAFVSGLNGVKLHAHVQCFDMTSEDMDVIYEVCSAEKKPLVIHAGREPKSPAYKCDPHVMCSAEKVEHVIRTYPNLKVCVPHLGADEFVQYKNLIEKYENLWLDTTMALADYLPIPNPVKLDDMRPDRILYGSDFPNIPYAWDREIRWFTRSTLTDDMLEQVLGKNAIELYCITPNSDIQK